MNKITNKKEKIIFKVLKKFFIQEKNIKKILPIIEGSTKLSLRDLDWFVTNYAKERDIRYEIEDDEDFVVFYNYKLQLKAYNKKLFDPFCRRKRIVFYYNESDYIITTIAQLNFFYWAIEYKVLDYVENHLNDIKNDMALNTKKNKKNLISITTETTATFSEESDNSDKIILMFD